MEKAIMPRDKVIILMYPSDLDYNIVPPSGLGGVLLSPSGLEYKKSVSLRLKE